jgi:hypothetical protein
MPGPVNTMAQDGWNAMGERRPASELPAAVETAAMGLVLGGISLG